MELRNGKFVKVILFTYHFSFFVPAPIISLEGDGWTNKLRQLQYFYEQQAKQRNIDFSRVPPPTIQGAIAVHEVADHPVLEFEFDDKTVSFRIEFEVTYPF
jgi:hypothetical protein